MGYEEICLVNEPRNRCPVDDATLCQLSGDGSQLRHARRYGYPRLLDRRQLVYDAKDLAAVLVVAKQRDGDFGDGVASGGETGRLDVDASSETKARNLQFARWFGLHRL